MKLPVALVFFSSCLLVFGGEVADLHSQMISQRTARERSDSWNKSRTDEETCFTNRGITEMGIEVHWHRGGERHMFIVKSDGSFRYSGVDISNRKGRFTGTIPQQSFYQLAHFVDDSKFMDLGEEYVDLRSTSGGTVYTTVVMNGKRKVISNRGNTGPTKLWAVEQLLDGLIARAKWNEPPIEEKSPWARKRPHTISHHLQELEGAKHQWALEYKKPTVAWPTKQDLAVYLQPSKSESEEFDLRLPPLVGELYIINRMDKPVMVYFPKSAGEFKEGEILTLTELKQHYEQLKQTGEKPVKK